MHSPTVSGRAVDPAAPDIRRRETLVLGCGNELFGDDGFGRAVARELCRRDDLPDGVRVVDVGTSVRQVLFDVALSEEKPGAIVVMDAVDMGREPGEVWTIGVDELPEVKCDDFSMHQLPTSNLLKELRDLARIEVSCVVAQVAGLPSEVAPGLSAPMRLAVDRAVELIVHGRAMSRGPDHGR